MTTHASVEEAMGTAIRDRFTVFSTHDKVGAEKLVSDLRALAESYSRPVFRELIEQMQEGVATGGWVKAALGAKQLITSLSICYPIPESHWSPVSDEVAHQAVESLPCGCSLPEALQGSVMVYCPFCGTSIQA